MKEGSDLESKLFYRINSYGFKLKLDNTIYKIKASRVSNRAIPVDLILNAGNKTIGLVEVKSNLKIKPIHTQQIEDYAAENNIRYVIITDGIIFNITDRKKNLKHNVTFNEIFNIISYIPDDIQVIKERVADKIRSIIDTSNFSHLKDHITELFLHGFNVIDYDLLEDHFSFVNPEDINSVENRIFRLLLNDNKPLKKIYRYTTLDTVFSMLSNNSFRMNCLVGMNDTSEVSYVENYLNDTNLNYVEADRESIDAYNKKFISSCSLKNDDLTQWRLYADDSKGVCLVLKVDEEQLNSKFILKRISYGSKLGQHPELDLIKQIVADLREELSIDFKFKTLNTWRHFFKPHNYSVEAEVRLLYIHNDKDLVKKGWLLTHSHKILNPYIEFLLNDSNLPVQLEGIVLGPKCAEKEINKIQLEQFIKDLTSKIIKGYSENDYKAYNLSKLKVSISEINNYR